MAQGRSAIYTPGTLNPNDSAALAVIAADPRYNAMLRTTCVPTMLTGGHQRAAAGGRGNHR